MQKIFVDTNILLDDPDFLVGVATDTYAIPFTVLRELDGLKGNEQTGYAARMAIKSTYLAIKRGVEVVDIPTDIVTNDERIVESVRRAGGKLLTNDIGCRMIAISKGLDVVDNTVDEFTQIEYSGYIEVDGDLSYEHYVPIKELPLEEFEAVIGVQLKINQYVMIKRVGGKTDIWKRQGTKVTRVAKTSKPYKDAGILVTPLDALQQCAWDSAFSDVSLTVLEGRVGSSKTMSALVGLLARTIGQRQHKKYKKIYYTRAPIPIDKSLELGFAPGDLEAKSAQWLLGITSNLKFLLGEDQAATLLAEVFEFVSLESIQGLSLQQDEAIICDEYQLLSRDMLKMLLTRAGEGTKVILAGDPVGQVYGINRAKEGFRVLGGEFGNTEFISYVRLDNVYRSAFVEYIDDLFEGKKHEI